MELTKEHFDQVIDGLAAKTDRLAEGLSNVKTDMIQVKETLDEHGEILHAITDTLDKHTTALVDIATDVKDWNTELVAVRARLDRHDQWFKQIADSLKLKLN